MHEVAESLAWAATLNVAAPANGTCIHTLRWCLMSRKKGYKGLVRWHVSLWLGVGA